MMRRYSLLKIYGRPNCISIQFHGQVMEELIVVDALTSEGILKYSLTHKLFSLLSK